MTGLERHLTKIINAISTRQRREAEPVAIPTAGQCEAEALYLSQWEAIESEERHLRLAYERPMKAIRYGCE